MTVYEIDPDIVENFKFNYSKLNILVVDVWDADPMLFDSVLLDIWNSYGSAEGNPKLVEWKRKHSRVWAWGDVGDWALDHSR